MSKYDWSDLSQETPYFQRDIFNFSYSREYKCIMGYFMAIIKKGEISERVLDLTETVLRFLCGNYSAWHLRKACLLKLEVPLEDEFSLLSSLIQDNEKCY